MSRDAILGLSIALLTGCASITTGTTQFILVDTNPPGAICRFSRMNKEVGVVNPTPGMLPITKDSAPLTVICTKAGFYPNSGSLKADFEPMSFGNILLGGLVGIIIDTASGASSKYDGSINIPLRKIEATNLNQVIEDIKQHGEVPKR